MKVKLIFTNKAGTKEHDLNMGEMIAIGRSGQCDFHLEDERMSAQHCRLSLNYDRLEVTDLDSKNGTYLNGIRVESSEVFIGDKIRIGATTITLAEPALDNEAVRVLSFPGATKDRLNYELKADFTGARINNQTADHNIVKGYAASHVKEIDLRKKIQSKIKLSKQEIRISNKIKSSVSSLIDSILMLIVLVMPFVVGRRSMPAIPNKNGILLLTEVLITALFFLLNFKIARFTIGESLSGIKSLYKNQ